MPPPNPYDPIFQSITGFGLRALPQLMGQYRWQQEWPERRKGLAARAALTQAQAGAIPSQTRLREAQIPRIEQQTEQLREARQRYADLMGNIGGMVGTPALPPWVKTPEQATQLLQMQSLGLQPYQPQMQAIKTIGEGGQPVTRIEDIRALQLGTEFQVGQTVPWNIQGQTVNIPVEDLHHYIEGQDNKTQLQTIRRMVDIGMDIEDILLSKGGSRYLNILKRALTPLMKFLLVMIV